MGGLYINFQLKVNFVNKGYFGVFLYNILFILFYIYIVRFFCKLLKLSLKYIMFSKWKNYCMKVKWVVIDL